MSKNNKRILLWALFLFGITLLFLPIRVDHVTEIISGDQPDSLTTSKTDQDFYSSAFIGFNGHPVGIAGIMFFALMPFFVVAQSFSIHRPFGFAAGAILKLEATLMFIGGPYVWYMITYQHGYFSNTTHETSPAWGGWVLISYVVVSGMILYGILSAPKSKIAGLFPSVK